MHTRARYALLVPWLFEDLAGMVGPAAQRALRERERLLAGRLKYAGEAQVIGGRVFPKPSSQPPSTVYWNALVVWGILRPRLDGRTISRGQALQFATDLDGRLWPGALRIAGAALDKHDLKLGDLLIAAHREAQRARTFMIQQFNIAFSEGHRHIAEADFDPVLDLRQQRFRPMDRDRWHRGTLADLTRPHRALEHPVGGNPGIIHGLADVRAPFDPVGEVADGGDRPEFAFRGAATRGGDAVEEAGRKDIVLDARLGLRRVKPVGDIDAHIHGVANAATLVVSQTQIAQDQAIEAMQAAEDFLAFDTTRCVATNGLGQPVIRALGGTADIEKLAVGIPMHHMQIPDDIDRMLGGGPAGLFLRPRHEDGDALMRIDLHAQIDARTIYRSSARSGSQPSRLVR
ncbi:hypothetical protein [Mesorhizobium waimense]|uniref:hypothetical protein n=1 Tax=Mesorhizobium waimense TaxID=1300307 RepID=UPI003CCAF2E2